MRLFIFIAPIFYSLSSFAACKGPSGNFSFEYYVERDTTTYTMKLPKTGEVKVKDSNGYLGLSLAVGYLANPDLVILNRKRVIKFIDWNATRFAAYVQRKTGGLYGHPVVVRARELGALVNDPQVSANKVVAAYRELQQAIVDADNYLRDKRAIPNFTLIAANGQQSIHEIDSFPFPDYTGKLNRCTTSLVAHSRVSAPAPAGDFLPKKKRRRALGIKAIVLD